MLEAIDGYEAIYRLLTESNQHKMETVRETIDKSIGQKSTLARARNRLKWLEGIGVGHIENDAYTISDAQQKLLCDVLHARDQQKESQLALLEEKRKRFFSVKQITDINSLVEAAAELGEERRKSLMEVRNRIDSYPFSVVTIQDQPIEIACEIFERVNNSGQVLSVVDLMVAKSWSKNFNLREKITEFRLELKAQNYNELSDIVLLQCSAGILQGEVNRKAILNLPNGILEKNWESILEAIRQAIDFLKSSLSLTHAKILPYNAIVVPLSSFFYQAGSKSTTQRTRDELVLWFWKASVGNRYDSGAESKMAEDIREMLTLSEGGEALFNYLAPPITAERVIKQPLNTGAAFCKTILCALNYQRPLELKDSSPVSLTGFSKFNAAELHHFFPQAYLRKKDPDNYQDKDSMANIVLARASANKEYSDKAPSVYLRDCNNSTLDKALVSHLVDNADEAGLWRDDFESFIEYRAENIARKLRELTGEMDEIEIAVINDEAIAIESFERRFRELIKSRLPDESVWIKGLSSEFQASLEGRIQAWLRENPTRQRADADAVNFCQVLDYLKIVKANMDMFGDVIRSKSELEAHLKTISNFRNAVAHGREIDKSSRQLALGSLMWCGNIFEAAGVQ